MAWKENFWCKFNFLNYLRISLCGIQNLKSLEEKVWVRREHRAQPPTSLTPCTQVRGTWRERAQNLFSRADLLFSLERFRAGRPL